MVWRPPCDPDENSEFYHSNWKKNWIHSFCPIAIGVYGYNDKNKKINKHPFQSCNPKSAKHFDENYAKVFKLFRNNGHFTIRI